MHEELRAVFASMVGFQPEQPMPKCTWAEALPGAIMGSTRACMRGARPTMTCFTREGVTVLPGAGVQADGPRP